MKRAGECAWAVWSMVMLTLPVLATDPATDPARVELVDVSQSCGVDFRHSTGSSGQRYIVETVVAGLATFDYDRDGRVDLYFLNGQPLPGSPQLTGTARHHHALYRNHGHWQFSEVTWAAGVPALAYGMGVAVGDYDQDGDDDLYLANFGKNLLYRNEGDGTFTDVTLSVGLDTPPGFGTGAVWLDIDGDGDLDLYAGRYVQFEFDQHQPRVIGGHLFHPGPAAYPPAPDQLFRNNGDGSFTDISQSSGIAAVAGTAMGAVAWDADDDGDIDLFVCNDGQPNFLFINNGHGQFTEQAFLAGVALDRLGKANGNMGVDLADVDGDGLLDLVTTDYQDEMPVLYRNLGGGQFEDYTSRAKIDSGLMPHVKWGVGLIDIDNDSHRDLFIACGHFLDNIQFIDDRTQLRVPNFLQLGNGRGRFSPALLAAGSGMQVVASSRGAAFDDLDNDGDVDIVVLNSDAPATLMRNDSHSGNQWLSVELIGTRSNRSAAGAKVELIAGGQRQVLAVHLGRGYQSHYGTKLMFGLGQHRQVESLTVYWPSGRTQAIEASQIQTNTLLRVVEQ